MIIAKDNSTEKFPKLPLPEAGTTQAVCCGVWDLGKQKTSYNGEDKVQHKVVIAWELTEKINEPGSEYHDKPYMLSKRYTLSLNERATLRHDLESWRGMPFDAETVLNGFDIEKLYGVNCFIGVKHEASKSDPSKVYANVSAILPLPKGIEKIIPLREKDEEPPKWVQDLQAQAVDDLPPLPDTSDDFPFGNPEYDNEYEPETV